MTLPKVFDKLALEVFTRGAKKATKYISPTLVVKATFRGKRRRNERQSTVLFTVGKPNFEERELIAKWKKIGARFPIKKIQLKGEAT